MTRIPCGEHAKLISINQRTDFNSETEIVGTVEEVHWFTDMDENLFQVGYEYKGMEITHAYIHPESDCAWFICKDNEGRIWEVNFDGYLHCGVSNYSNYR
jgi:hypothetical protein